MNERCQPISQSPAVWHVLYCWSKCVSLAIVCSTCLGIIAIPNLTYAADPPSWNLFEYDFGSDAGKVSFITAPNAITAGNGFTVGDYGGGHTEVMSADSSRVERNDSQGSLYAAGDQVLGGMGTAGDFTWETRAAVGPGKLEYYADSLGDTTTFALRLFPDNTPVNNQLNVGGVSQGCCVNVGDNLPADFDFSQFHTYRIVRQGTAQPNMTLQIDGQTIVQFEGEHRSKQRNDMNVFFGSPFGAAQQVDYIRAADGAFLVPEPSGILLALLAVSCLTAFVGRKRERR